MRKRKGWKGLWPKPDFDEDAGGQIGGMKSVLFIAIIFVFIAGCSFGIDKSLLVTQKTFNDMVKDYHVYYLATSPEKQAKLEKNVHPRVIEALKLLTGINEAVRLGIEPNAIDRNRFRELRFELYRKLPQIFSKMEGTL